MDWALTVWQELLMTYAQLALTTTGESANAVHLTEFCARFHRIILSMVNV